MALTKASTARTTAPNTQQHVAPDVEAGSPYLKFDR
jgi:hypothetical protein